MILDYPYGAVIHNIVISYCYTLNCFFCIAQIAYFVISNNAALMDLESDQIPTSEGYERNFQTNSQTQINSLNMISHDYYAH